MINFIKITFLVLGLSLSLTACKDDKLEFVEGEILFSLQDSTSFFDAYMLFDSLKIKIKAAYNFEYVIKTPVDSVDLIKQTLRSKQYLKKGNHTFGMLYKNDSLFISANFFDIESIHVTDWSSTVQQLSLKEYYSNSTFKFGVLGVTYGQEEFWAQILRRFPIMKLATVNHYLEQ
jgi:hypothetical protein